MTQEQYTTGKRTFQHLTKEKRAPLNEKLNSTSMLNLVLHSTSISFIIFSTCLSAVEKRYLCVNQFPEPKSI